MEEVWKDIPNFEGIYEVSNLGNVRSRTRIIECRNGQRLTKYGCVIKGNITLNGYRMVDLQKGGKRHMKLVHRLVAIVFIPNPYNFPQVNHKNENKLDNRMTNLEWCTGSYNSTYNNLQERRYSAGGGRRKRPVEQLTKEGKHIATFQSIKEASLATKCQPTSIIQVCSGKFKTSLGYKWKYL